MFKSQWLGISKPDNNTHFEYVSSFEADGFNRVTIRISAKDYYKLYINGEFVGQGPAPSFKEDYAFNEYDITKYVKIGENSIKAEVYYQGLINRVWTSGDGVCGIIADIYADGKLISGTDESWLYRVDKSFTGGEIFGYDTGFSENRDFTKKAESFKNAEPCKCPLAFSDKAYPSVQSYPVSIKPEIKNGVLCYDFKQEYVCNISVRAVSEADGAVLTLRAGEEEENGRVRYNLRCGCSYEEAVILKKGENNFTQFEYKALRYLEICVPEGVKAECEILVRHYPYSGGALKTEDKKLAAVLSLCERTVKYGVQENYIDCPTREKGQYLGDAFITGFAHYYLTKDSTVLRRALVNFARTAELYGDMLSVAPCSYRQKIADYTLLYPLAVLRLYRLTHDRALLESTFFACEFIVSSFDKIRAEYWQLIDWPENLRDGYEFDEKKPHAVFDAYCVCAASAYEKICESLGKSCSKKSEALRSEFNKNYFKNGVYTDNKESRHASVHANALALAFDICEEKNKGAVADYLIKRGMECSPFMAYFYLSALCKASRYNEALGFIKDEGKHGWLNMIKEGATTCYEVWGKDEKWNTSLFHPWSVAPIVITAEYFADLLI